MKDKLGRAGSTTVFFFWSPRCLSATYRQAYTRQLHDIAGELYEILKEKFGHAIGEKFFAWLVSGVETPPLAHVLLLLTGAGKELAIKWQQIREALSPSYPCNACSSYPQAARSPGL